MPVVASTRACGSRRTTMSFSSDPSEWPRSVPVRSGSRCARALSFIGTCSSSRSSADRRSSSTVAARYFGPMPVPHTFGLPPPPHVWPGGQSHVMRPPQPSATGPHFPAACAHVSLLQFGAPHSFGTPPPPHVWPGGHGPQSMSWPQPLPAGPHLMFCCWHVSGEHVAVPHLFAPPPPHVSPGAHGGHVTVPPHPFGSDPHAPAGQTPGVHGGMMHFAGEPWQTCPG